MPTLAIIIPALNEEKYLPTLFASIKKQTRQPDEVIIADAGSTDRTLNLAREFGAAIVPGGMPGPARNSGAREARSEILLFLDADVYLPDPSFLENAIREFEEKEFDIATVDLILEKGSAPDKFQHAFYNRYVRLWGRVHPHAPGGCIFVRKSLHQAIKGFDETVVFCEDHDYAVRANKIGKFGFLNTAEIAVTTRRLDKDGRLNVALKYTLAEMHLLFLGPIRHDRFNYTFDYTKKKGR